MLGGDLQPVEGDEVSAVSLGRQGYLRHGLHVFQLQAGERAGNAAKRAFAHRSALRQSRQDEGLGLAVTQDLIGRLTGRRDLDPGQARGGDVHYPFVEPVQDVAVDGIAAGGEPGLGLPGAAQIGAGALPPGVTPQLLADVSVDQRGALRIAQDDTAGGAGRVALRVREVEAGIQFGLARLLGHQAHVGEGGDQPPDLPGADRVVVILRRAPALGVAQQDEATVARHQLHLGDLVGCRSEVRKGGRLAGGRGRVVGALRQGPDRAAGGHHRGREQDGEASGPHGLRLPLCRPLKIRPPGRCGSSPPAAAWPGPGRSPPAPPGPAPPRCSRP